MTAPLTCVGRGAPCLAGGVQAGGVPGAVPVVGRGLAAFPGRGGAAGGRRGQPGGLASCAVFCEPQKVEFIYTGSRLLFRCVHISIPPFFLWLECGAVESTFPLHVCLFNLWGQSS